MKSSKSWLIYRGGSGLQTGLGETLARAGGQLTLFFSVAVTLQGDLGPAEEQTGPSPSTCTL